jgi:hypothetical protein
LIRICFKETYMRDDGCCDAERDARAQGYGNAREADADNWGIPWPDEKPKCNDTLDKPKSTLE